MTNLVHNDDHPVNNDRQNDDQRVNNDEQSISIYAAAERLGVSTATIRRRIKERKIAAFQRPTERGFEWRILLDQPVKNVDHIVDQPVHIVAQEVSIDMQKDDQAMENVDQEPTGVIPELIKTLDMLAEERQKVDQLQTDLREASNAAAHWQARAVAAEQTVQRLLPAPKDEPAEPEQPAAPETKRAWWRRLLGD